MKIQKPFSGDFLLTQKFGVPYAINGKAYIHQGIDFACPNRTPILACAAGKIKATKLTYTDFDYGKEIVISHDGFESQYAHLSGILVNAGQEVKAGQVIGHSGRTGYCRGITGYHLHFGIFCQGSWIDPEPLLAEKAVIDFENLKASNKLIPLVRLFNPETLDHFNTTSVKEGAEAVKKYGYVIEGVLGFVYAVDDV